jgi:hypothetical protein
MRARRSASPSTTTAAAVPHRRSIGLDAAISEIRQSCEELGSEPQRSPFFFVVGAGISWPPVPLAAEIIEHCRGVAKRYSRGDEPGASATLDAYSHWFSRAYPSARQRQKYLRSLIEKQPLSLAGLRLAHLLSARKVTNLVVTTNFDDFIARALRLFGEEPAVCDHPSTVGRIDRERDDIQIVHVHGSYLFYDCANLRGEVTGRARPDQDTSLTMVGLLDNIFWNRSPLVIGYSGWEGDVIMSALRRRLRGGNPLAQSIYWFCYRERDFAQLPSWLRESADVRFVVPPPPAQTGPTQTEERVSARRSERKPEPTLQAFEVFDQINRAFEIGTPPLFENPIEYFARNLKAALPAAAEPGGDPYAFKALIEKLHRAAQQFARTWAPSGLEKDLDRLRTAVRESDYPRAVELLAKVVPFNLGKLDADTRKEVLATAELAGSAMLTKGVPRESVSDLATVLAIDPKLEQFVGTALKDVVCIMGSRWGRFAFQTDVDGKAFGAFTYQFASALADSSSDYNGDGQISLLEAVVESGRRILRASLQTEAYQTPTVAGDAAGVTLFSARKVRSAGRTRGNLHAVLIGVGKYRDPDSNDLGPGPLNDVARIKDLLEKRDHRLFRKATAYTLIDKAATRSRVESKIADIADSTNHQDTFLVYFSGHGTRRGYAGKVKDVEDILLFLHDFSGNAGVLSLRKLLKLVALAEARHKIVILDF